MNLKTTYLGLKLRTPLVVSASPLSESLDNLKRMEEAGASAVVLFSLFEEEIRYKRYELHWTTTQGTERYPDALTYLSDPHELCVSPEAYLQHINRAKKSVMIPIEEEMRTWLREHEYESVEQLKGRLSHKNCPDPSAFERAHYMRTVGVRRAG